jgi:protein-L-isoaspartate(D-aspartate) O-methyltransferase
VNGAIGSVMAMDIHREPRVEESREGKSDWLERLRRLYARDITVSAGLSPDNGLGREIAAALESIPRERFVGPPPWSVVGRDGSSQTPTDDPAVLYQDALVSLDADKGLNNGQPSLHAMCLNALAPQKGERAVHVGAGSGYYTAILAALVGESGRVDAYEIDPGLARQATANLAQYPQVEAHERSGVEVPLPRCDVLYVSAAAAEPLAVWLDALRLEGRLLFPLEPEAEAGQMLLITRREDGLYSARFLCGVQFVACIGAQEPHAADALKAAFRKGNANQVRSLFLDDEPDQSCWCAGRGWWLSTREHRAPKTDTKVSNAADR